MNTHSAQNKLLHFFYKSGDGTEREYRLDKWKESGHYITTVLPEGYRTLRKDRVTRYLAGKSKLRDPHPAPFIRPIAMNEQSHTVRDEICFTGFTKQQREELSEVAKAAGMLERMTVTKNLKYLCIGKTAGPGKMSKARKSGVLLLLESDFHTLLKTGELPDSQIPHSERLVIDRPQYRDEDKFLSGFAFNLPKAFLDALDIKYTPRVDAEETEEDLIEHPDQLSPEKDMVWTQSCPPLFSFRASDVIHRADGSETIQLTQAMPGHNQIIFFDLFRGNRRCETWRMTQTALVSYLVSGEINLDIMQKTETYDLVADECTDPK